MKGVCTGPSPNSMPKRSEAIDSTSSKNGSTVSLDTFWESSWPNWAKPPERIGMASSVGAGIVWGRIDCGITEPTLFCTMVLFGAMASDMPIMPL